MKISVVIPSFNESANIVSCLESLNRQTIPRQDYEIIVVDGGSSDSTRDLAESLADLVFIQTSRKVGGARNDGAMRAQGPILATTDADCIIPRNWLEVILDDFGRHPDAVQLYGPVDPIEKTLKNHLSLAFANTFARLGYYTHTLYYTLGCNTAFRKEAFFRAGMYHFVDAGDDLEIARRMKKVGRVMFDNRMRVGFSMRRYEQFGTLKSLYEWLYIVAHGGSSEKHQYTRREYK
ncbi:MAG: Glycosyltransferase AglE [Methanoregulaceae archaeon PtaB.Bin056]|nr:MAG: Glycosyltransferase AglE [Methanoregulaceae archaeon PtaB.Bin056]